MSTCGSRSYGALSLANGGPSSDRLARNISEIFVKSLYPQAVGFNNPKMLSVALANSADKRVLCPRLLAQLKHRTLGVQCLDLRGSPFLPLDEPVQG